jgi:hypothetical protein
VLTDIVKAGDPAVSLPRDDDLLPVPFPVDEVARIRDFRRAADHLPALSQHRASFALISLRIGIDVGGDDPGPYVRNHRHIWTEANWAITTSGCVNHDLISKGRKPLHQ